MTEVLSDCRVYSFLTAPTFFRTNQFELVSTKVLSSKRVNRWVLDISVLQWLPRTPRDKLKQALLTRRWLLLHVPDKIYLIDFSKDGTYGFDRSLSPERFYVLHSRKSGCPL